MLMGKVSRDQNAGYADGDLQAEVAKLQKALLEMKQQNKDLQARVHQLEEEVSVVRNIVNHEPDDEDKKRLMKHLEKEAYVELFASPIAGVGVRAFRPIPAGVDPFPICNMHMAAKERFCVCSASELKAMPPGIFDKVKSFFAALTEDDGWTPQRNRDGEIIYGVLSTGMNNLNLSWYLNHSDTPNIGFQDAEDDGGYNSFVTRRPIEAGEELTTDYRELGKEFFALVSTT